jgi:hypothetical protein
MQVDFLQASIPLTKYFKLKDEGGFETQPYPMVKHFTSHRESFSTIEELLPLLQRHAAQGHCLLKGRLNQPLNEESRAGMTNGAEHTSWLLLDLDFSTGDWGSIEQFVDDISPEFKDVSFIFQHSSSAGIKYPTGFRGHIWILLDKPESPEALKRWLRYVNLNNSRLTDQIRLAANGHALVYPLDTTTCQNDKLIYIAPPVCDGFLDPIADQRFRLIKRSRDFAASPVAEDATSHKLTRATNRRVAALREAAGLPEVAATFKSMSAGVQVLLNPDKATVSDFKIGRGFVYVNLNGGDSWGYYFPKDRPTLLYNFKNEPVVRIKDIAPDFYEQYIKLADIGKTQTAFVFRDWKNDVYYNALYDATANTLEMAKAASVQRLQHFMLQHDEIPEDVIEDWTVRFDPTSLKLVDFEERTINSFQPTTYINNPPEVRTEVPPQIFRAVSSICGHDAEVIKHFLNWLAFIFQTRRKTGTAWIFHGTHGTGKGVLIDKVLRPILGDAYVTQFTATNFEDMFNALIEKSIILNIDEFTIDSARSSGVVMNRMKNLITEPRIAIRAMRTDTITVDNFTNLIITTNHPDPVHLSPNDRRFNVAPAQEIPLKYTEAEIELLKAEVPLFAGYLQGYDVSEEDARTILITEARGNMIEAATTSVDKLLTSCRAGDLDFFMEFLSASMPLSDTIFYTEYEKMILSWCKSSLSGDPYFLTMNDMRTAYAYIIGSPTPPGKFRRMLEIHRIVLGPGSQNGVPTNGLYVNWRGDPEFAKTFLASRKIKPSLSVVATDVHAG